MGVVRTIVFPALRLLVWGLIAVALLYIAFGRGGPEEAGAASPSAVLAPAETTVSRGDVVNTVSLSGSIQADPSTTVKATAAGTVGRVRATAGDTVEKGTPLFTVLVPVEETAPAVPADPAAPAPAPAAPRTRTVTVTATVPGTLATLDVLPAQPVSIGDAVATVSPGTLTVSAPLTQDQQFRLLAAPSSAAVTVPGGPGTFECTDLRTGIPVAGATAPAPVQQDPYAFGGGVDPGSTPTGATVTCRVPADVQVFPGLSATVEVTAGRAAGVLLAPVTAVQGRVAKGSLWLLDDAGTPTETAVTLGLTDGEFVEVTGGVAEGARILQFVPGTDEIAPGGDGSVVYG